MSYKGEFHRAEKTYVFFSMGRKVTYDWKKKHGTHGSVHFGDIHLDLSFSECSFTIFSPVEA